MRRWPRGNTHSRSGSRWQAARRHDRWVLTRVGQLHSKKDEQKEQTSQGCSRNGCKADASPSDVRATDPSHRSSPLGRAAVRSGSRAALGRCWETVVIWARSVAPYHYKCTDMSDVRTGSLRTASGRTCEMETREREPRGEGPPARAARPEPAPESRCEAECEAAIGGCSQRHLSCTFIGARYPPVSNTRNDTQP